MEDFLNSYAFEQMAKAYNQKYGVHEVGVLTKKEDERFLLKVENAFDKVFHLFYLLKMRFGRDVRFKNLFEQTNILKINIKQTFKYCFNKEYIEKDNTLYIDNIKSINYKSCGLEILAVFESFFDLLQIVERGEKNCLNGDLNPFWGKINGIFKEMLKILKDFYILL